MKQKGVISGDIIGSSKIAEPYKEQLYAAIQEFLNRLSEEEQIRYEWYRGDSFQIVGNQPHRILAIALMLKFKIRSLQYKPRQKPYDARLAISIGTVDQETDHVTTSDGEAYRLSGRLLDNLKPMKQDFAITSGDTYAAELEIESLLLDRILSRTRPAQCEVLYRKMHGQTELEIATELGIHQSAVNQRSTSGNWNAFSRMNTYFENLYRHE